MNKKCPFTKKRKAIFFCVISLIIGLVISVPDYAQVFGGNPPSIRWQQINTDTARVIFPEGLEETGKRVASIIHELQKNHTATIGNKLRKVNIVLQNQSTVSNAYVALGPYRSEFYLFPPQNSFLLGAQNWADNLAVHEYRHVEQYNNFNIGLSKAFSIIFGQEGQALANALSVPDWFFEGDAVFNETSLTRQGRGRLPGFFNGYQSLAGEGKHYSYMKLRNGSLRHLVPNHYELGYLLVAYGREKYGADFWKKVSRDAASYKPLLYPWQGAVKKYAGIGYKQFVGDAMSFYKNKWTAEKDGSISYITPSHKNYVTDYKYPYPAENGSVIVLKRGYRNIPAIYRVDTTGRETKITVRNIANEDYFSYNGGKVIFSEYKPHERWGYREYSDLVLVNAATGLAKRITHNERYFSPDVSHSGEKVVAVEMRTNQLSGIVVVDQKGNKLFRSEAKRGIVYTYPKFSADDQFIYSAVRNGEGGMALIKIEMATGKEVDLVPFQNRIIGFPVVQGDTVFFSSSFKGSDEIWAFIESKKKAYRVATAYTGLYQAFYQPAKNRLISSNFTAEGYRLAAFTAPSLLWQPVSQTENALPDLYVPEALREENKATLENVSVRNFRTAKYHKSYNFFNFHSWQPDYTDPEFSFSLLGENVLNTFQSQLSYTYNRNERSHNVGFDAIFGGWYVQPFVGVSQTWNRNILYNRDTTFTYNEFNGHVGLQLPLNFTGGKMFRNLTVSSTLNNQHVNWTGTGKNLFPSSGFNYIEGTLSYVQQIQKAAQHIYPRFAQTLFFRYRRSFGDFSANQLLAVGNLYLPGFHQNHNIVLSAAIHSRDTLNQYLFSNSFPFSRGHSAIDFPRMLKLGANYHFPLLYPDWGFGNIIYFKRIRSNVFYDHTAAKSLRTGNIFTFNSIGGEIFFDTKWWNQLEASFGIRYSRLLNNEYSRSSNPYQWEVVLPVNLFD